MKIRFLPELPVTTKEYDSLGFRTFINVIKNAIYNTIPPFVFGILGEWGVGKTSIMRLLENELSSDIQLEGRKFIPIWFNPWEYENEVNILYPLLHSINKDYESRNFSKVDKDWFIKKLKKVAIATTVASSDLFLRTVTRTIIGESIKVEDISKQLELIENKEKDFTSVLKSWTNEVSQIKDTFQSLLDIYASHLIQELYADLKKEQIVFVIMVDDLDRCLPETAITILEKIKNFLTVHNCIFILGLNPSVIYQGIKIKYHGLDIDGREYIEKILNYSFHVPHVLPNVISTFIINRLNELVVEKEAKDKLKDKFEEFGTLVEQCKFDNPRKIKRLLNRYLLFINEHIDSDLDKYINSNTTRLLIIGEYNRSILEAISNNGNNSIQDFANLGTRNCKYDEIEKAYGLSLKEKHEQLAKLNQLFQFQAPQGDLHLGKHAKEILLLSRFS